MNCVIKSSKEHLLIKDLKQFLVEHEYYGNNDYLEGYDVFDFLTSELQCLRILRFRSANNKIDSYKNELKELTNTMNISQTINATEQLKLIIDNLDNKKEDKGTLILNKSEYSNDEINQINELNNLLFNDFIVRKEMLNCRLEVSIQSLLWSTKVKGMESNIISEIQPLRNKIINLYKNKIEINELFECTSSV